MAQKTAPRLTLQLVRFEYRHIYSIDQLAQTFSARVFILLKIPAGEFQERKAQLLPEGDSGEDKPPFKSARWYLSQLRLHNMVDGGSGKCVRTLAPEGVTEVGRRRLKSISCELGKP